MWTCPKCKRQFTRKSQRHACGTGSRAEVLRNRPAHLVELYSALEEFARSLGPVEFVTRERYVLLRTRRIFADLVVMTDSLRIAIHLPKRMKHPLFIKVGADRKQVTHVARICRREELEALKKFLVMAYDYSMVSNST